MTLTPRTSLVGRDPSSESFSASCIPRVAELASLVRPLLEKHVFPESEWEFEDRLLAWLVPEIEPTVRAFYEHGGAALLERHSAHLVDALDAELLLSLSREIEELLSDEIGRLVLANSPGPTGPEVAARFWKQFRSGARKRPLVRGTGRPPLASEGEAQEEQPAAAHRSSVEGVGPRDGGCLQEETIWEKVGEKWRVRFVDQVGLSSEPQKPQTGSHGDEVP